MSGIFQKEIRVKGDYVSGIIKRCTDSPYFFYSDSYILGVQVIAWKSSDLRALANEILLIADEVDDQNGGSE